MEKIQAQLINNNCQMNYYNKEDIHLALKISTLKDILWFLSSIDMEFMVN